MTCRTGNVRLGPAMKRQSRAALRKRRDTEPPLRLPSDMAVLNVWFMGRCLAWRCGTKGFRERFMAQIVEARRLLIEEVSG